MAVVARPTGPRMTRYAPLALVVEREIAGEWLKALLDLSPFTAVSGFRYRTDCAAQLTIARATSIRQFADQAISRLIAGFRRKKPSRFCRSAVPTERADAVRSFGNRCRPGLQLVSSANCLLSVPRCTAHNAVLCAECDVVSDTPTTYAWSAGVARFQHSSVRIFIRTGQLGSKDVSPPVVQQLSSSRDPFYSVSVNPCTLPTRYRHLICHDVTRCPTSACPFKLLLNRYRCSDIKPSLAHQQGNPILCDPGMA